MVFLEAVCYLVYRSVLFWKIFHYLFCLRLYSPGWALASPTSFFNSLLFSVSPLHFSTAYFLIYGGHFTTTVFPQSFHNYVFFILSLRFLPSIWASCMFSWQQNLIMYLLPHSSPIWCDRTFSMYRFLFIKSASKYLTFLTYSMIFSSTISFHCLAIIMHS